MARSWPLKRVGVSDSRGRGGGQVPAAEPADAVFESLGGRGGDAAGRTAALVRGRIIMNQDDVWYRKEEVGIGRRSGGCG